MNQRPGFARLAAAATLCMASITASAEPNDLTPFVPFDGPKGYQEIPLGGDAWYVGYHGLSGAEMPKVQAAWIGRAAQLCASSGKPFVVELRYIGEPVFQNESAVEPEYAVARQVVYFVYVPGRYVPPLHLGLGHVFPAKMAAMRCVASGEGLRQGMTAIPIGEAIAYARAAGIKVP